MTNEIRLPEFPNYIIRKDGVIWSLNRKHALKPTQRPAITGTFSVRLTDASGKYVIRNVAQLVARAHLTGPEGQQVEHIDGDRRNCKASNLRWIGGVVVDPSSAPKMQSIPGYPGYWVTIDGRVFSRRGNKSSEKLRELSQNLNSAEGYMQVTLSVEGKHVTRRVYKLVALAYLGEPPFPGAHVRHLDGNKLNVLASNLAWGTSLENELDKKRHGRTSRKYSEDVVIAAAARYKRGGISLRKCAIDYNIGLDALRWYLTRNSPPGEPTTRPRQALVRNHNQKTKP